MADEYHSLYEELKPSKAALEALRSKARLYAFYLDEIDSAISILSALISYPGTDRLLTANAKLDLGDMYLLKDVPWEATLLYSQVERSWKDHPMGYEAKLKNARLHYFVGNFSLAKSHLDILKLNTTREIANDAISLGMLVTDNTTLDTSDWVMRKFANIELLIYRNKKLEARDELLQLLQHNKEHAITDEIYWLLSKLELDLGGYQNAIDYLDLILNSYSHDILADDAAFKRRKYTIIN